ncbi:sigma intracellular receptor 2-like [Oscarella lobularis]|uniref:sigma intracellular receptor 2-like n=1 Tax=Oscarella lobularis TaxID=121494 RepID=UPI0033131835
MAITSRPLDCLIVLTFASFLVIAIFIDLLQATLTENLTADALENRIWPPDAVRRLYLWWCQEVDTLLAANPLWYKTLALASPLLYAPFYVLAIYAFVNEREWIKAPGLCWAWGMVLVMIPILAEQFAGTHTTKNVTLCLLGYLPYVVFPILFAARLAIPSTVFGAEAIEEKKRS